MLGLGIFSWVNLLMECSCMALLTPVAIVMMGLAYQPLFCRVLISESYFVCFQVSACSGNLSWQYVNFINWIVRVGEGDMGVCVWLGAPIMHRMSGLSLAWHLHGLCWHKHLISQSGIVCCGVVLLSVPALVSVKNQVFLLAWSI